MLEGKKLAILQFACRPYRETVIAEFMKKISLLPVAAAATVALSAFAGHMVADSQAPAPANNSLPAGTITAGGKFSNHLESGWLDATVPFAQAGNVTLFGDLRGTWDDRHQLLLSVGLGARYLVPGHDIIIGGNIYYDYIDSQFNNHFDQLGLGAELLTKWFDARFNYYHPDNGVHPAVFGPGFLLNESALDGFNLEAGFLVPGLDKYVETRLFAGYYQYHSRVGPKFEGWKARAEIRWTPAITTDIEYWGGNTAKANVVNGGNWIAGVRVSLPFDIGNLFAGKSPFAGAGDAFKFGKRREFRERLGEQVWRSHREQTTFTPFSGNPAPPSSGGQPPAPKPVSGSTPVPTPKPFSPTPFSPTPFSPTPFFGPRE